MCGRKKVPKEEEAESAGVGGLKSCDMYRSEAASERSGVAYPGCRLETLVSSDGEKSNSGRGAPGEGEERGASKGFRPWRR